MGRDDNRNGRGRQAMERERPLILVVEDDHDIANLIRHQLSTSYRFAFATSGAEALRIALEEPPDAITLDLGLPDIPGDVVLERLASDPRTRDVPVVIISVRGDEVEPSNRAVAVLTKPVDRATLRRTIAHALERGSRPER